LGEVLECFFQARRDHLTARKVGQRISVFYEIERRPGMISIPVGAFAEVYEEARCPWLPDLGLPHH
jgi:hypothetical protein